MLNDQIEPPSLFLIWRTRFGVSKKCLCEAALSIGLRTRKARALGVVALFAEKSTALIGVPLNFRALESKERGSKEREPKETLKQIPKQTTVTKPLYVFIVWILSAYVQIGTKSPNRRANGCIQLLIDPSECRL